MTINSWSPVFVLSVLEKCLLACGYYDTISLRIYYSRRSSDGLPDYSPVTGISTQTLAEIYGTPGNDKCVDCMRRGPKWASINLGVVLCIDCSGHHRGLGVHLSQIRSLILDSIREEWLVKITEMGNTKFNSIFEANLAGEDKLQLVGDEKNLRQFIIDKYQNLKFTEETERVRITFQREETRQRILEKYCSEKDFDLVTQGDVEYSDSSRQKKFDRLLARTPSPKQSSDLLNATSSEAIRQKVKSVGSIGSTIARIGSGKKT